RERSRTTSAPCSIRKAGSPARRSRDRASPHGSNTFTRVIGWYPPKPPRTRPWTIETGKGRSSMRIASLPLFAILVPALFAQESGKRIALIIGNDAYSISPLKNAINDARAMEKALKSAGFQTIEVENAKRADMELKLG